MYKKYFFSGFKIYCNINITQTPNWKKYSIRELPSQCLNNTFYLYHIFTICNLYICKLFIFNLYYIFVHFHCIIELMAAIKKCLVFFFHFRGKSNIIELDAFSIKKWIRNTYLNILYYLLCFKRRKNMNVTWKNLMFLNVKTFENAIETRKWLW